nr:PREDICTED: N-alpha-acetyltransferase 38, NatC auxiliary subunit [Bemisia tabaci]
MSNLETWVDGPADGESTDPVSKKTAALQKLRNWINKMMRIEMTDTRILVGRFICTDRDGNTIMASCHEYLNPDVCGFSDEPRLLGLVMVPGRHIVSVSIFK